MTPHDQTTFDPRIADWLEDDPNNAPDQALEIVLAAFPSIKQRHASRLPRRFTMTTLPRLAIGAAAIVVVVLGGAFLLRPPASGVGRRRSDAVTVDCRHHEPVAVAVTVTVAVSVTQPRRPLSTAGWAPVLLEPLRVRDRAPADVGRNAGHASLGTSPRIGCTPVAPGGASDVFDGIREWTDTAVPAFAARRPGRNVRGPRGSRPTTPAGRLLPDDADFRAGDRRRPRGPARHLLRRTGVRLRRTPRVRLRDLADRRCSRSSRPSCRRSSSRRAAPSGSPGASASPLTGPSARPTLSPGTPPARARSARGPRRRRPRPAATNTGSGRPPGRPLAA